MIDLFSIDPEIQLYIQGDVPWGVDGPDRILGLVPRDPLVDLIDESRTDLGGEETWLIVRNDGPIFDREVGARHDISHSKDLELF